MDVGDGISVRVGINADHASVNSAAMLYCIAEGYDVFLGVNGRAGGTELGPLTVGVRRGITSAYIPRWTMAMSLHGESSQGCTLWFARPVVMDDARSSEVVLLTAAGRPIASATVTADDKFYHPWTPFRLEAEGSWKHAPTAYEPDTLAVLSVPGIGVALPDQAGAAFKLYAGDPSGYLYHGNRRPVAPPDPNEALPPLVSDQPDPKLTLRIDGDRVSIVDAGSDNEHLETNRPDVDLLARWWVNGTPFVPRPGDATRPVDSIVNYPTKGATRAFGLKFTPSALGAKSGDHVSFQLAYGQWGYTSHPNDFGGSGVRTRLTNRVDFLVP